MNQGSVYRLILSFQGSERDSRKRAKNLSTYTTDQEAFEAQKNTAEGKKTFKAYLWSVCGAEYDAQHNG